VIPPRRLLLLAGLGAALPPAVGAAAAHGLPPAASLRQEIAAALQQRKALVVMVSLDGCPFCKVARESYLLPLLREGQPLVQVDMNSPRALADALGRASTHGAQVAAWKVRVAPTVLFLGAEGRELAPRLEGAGIPDFYGAYLDERVAAANRRVAG
jgi:hypothetical protein